MTTTLRIYRAPSGQWAGRVIDDGTNEDICGVAGCVDADDVEQAVLDTYQQVDAVVIETQWRIDISRF
jgi:hypothetical protein